MKKNIVLVISAILFLAIFACAVMLCESDTKISMSVFVGTGAEIEDISCWEDENGAVYFFLPSYVDLTDVHISKEDDTQAYIGADELLDGGNLAHYEVGTSYPFTYTSGSQVCETTVTFLQSDKLPTLYIDTQSGSMEYIHVQKGTEESGVMRLYSPDGILEYSGKIDNMNGRGNASWSQSEKKPYSLSLEKEADLLGMGSADKWILLANALDSSHMRNKVAFELARTMGLQHTAQSEWVDLYLNGEYVGLYQLCERNEVEPQRVNITDTGFLVSMEMLARLEAQSYPHVTTEQGLAFRLHYPSAAGTVAGEKVAKVLQSVENAVLSEDGMDPSTGQKWDNLIDTDSWARMFLMCEVIGNLDSFKASQYFYADAEEGKIFAGPLWDSDKALGNDDDLGWSITNPDTFVVCRYLKDDFVGPEWIRSLLKKEEFYTEVMRLFRDEFYPVIESELDNMLREYEQTIASSFEMNMIRWQRELSSGTIQEETAQVRDYVREHIEFLYSAWVEDVPYCQITFREISPEQFMTVVSGETLASMPAIEDTESTRFLGWYYADTDEPFDPETPITEDIEIYAKWEETPTKRIKQVAKLMPLGVIVVMGATLAVIEVRRWRKRR